MKKHLDSLIIILLLTFCVTVHGKDKAAIRGLIVDKTNDEPLAGVNVIIKGTYYGASSDREGFYIIPEVEPGEYTIEVSYISYKVIQKTGVKIKSGEDLTLNFELEPSILALGQEIVIVGEKPLLDIEETSTIRNISEEDIENRIVENLTDIVSQQVGVVEQDDEIHIRGGRSYESQYLLEGVSVQDPLSGTGFGLKISSNALEEVEVITGGYKSEYGQATSGIINVKTKSGGNNYSGYFSYKSDHSGLFRDQNFSFNTDNYEFNLGGPEPLTNSFFPKLGLNLPGKFYFFMNFQALIADDYTGSAADQLYSYITPTYFGVFDETSFCPRENNIWSSLFKLTWKIDPTHKLTYAYNRSFAVNQNTQSLQTNLEYIEPKPGFPYEFSHILDNFNTFTHDNEQISLTWSHTINATTFYDLKFSRYFAQLRSEWQNSSWEDHELSMDVPRLPIEYYTLLSDSNKMRVIPGDGLYDYGNSKNWHDHYIEFYTLKADITSRISEIHSIKGGIELSFKEMQLVDIVDPWVGNYGSSQDIYRVYPADGAIYIQDDIRFGGFILNAGLRLDYWAPGEFVDRAVEDTTNFISDAQRKKYKDETYSFLGRQVKMRLMPRIGVSFPITNNQMLYFNYGHFSKLPRPQFVYAKLGGISAKSAYQKYGNPALNPETSVKYELGIRHQFTENDVISIAAYSKDIFDYVQTVRFNIPGRGGQTGYTYANLDYARSRGFEVEYKTRIARYFYGDISGTYSITTTKASNENIAIQIDKTKQGDMPIKETYARWDRPWQVSANASIRISKEDRPSIFGIRLFNNWNLNVRFFAQAGKRYTPAVFSGSYRSDGKPLYYIERDVEEKNKYSKLSKYWSWVDLSFKKYFDFWNIRYTAFLEVKNLLNRKNPQTINPVTGDAYNYGDPLPGDWNDPVYPDRHWPHDAYPYDPARYRAPRQILFGLSAEF
jgi:outer membrane receptor protein involved in Fe transport